MKLIIEIDKKCYESVRYYDGDIMNEWDDHIGCAIFNATPFDTLIEDIKAEVKAEIYKRNEDWVNCAKDYTSGMKHVLEIINKHISERETE